MSAAAWALFGALLVAAVAVLARAALAGARRGGGEARAAYDLQIYRDQLAELDNDLDRGVVSPEQAQAARTEIERRVLALGTAPDRGPARAGRRTGGVTAGALAIAVPALTALIYALVGTPGAPDMPLAARESVAPPEMPADVEEAVGRLAARLESEPDDLQGWLLLGRSYAFLERYDQAAVAFGTAAALVPDDTEVAAAYGEALLFAADGVVTPAAREQFEAVLARDAKHEGARLYLGMAAAQAGELERAFDIWRALAEDADGSEPWLAALRAQLMALSRELGVEAPAVALEAAPTAPAAEAPGPGPEDLEMAAGMSPDERMAAIDSMVARLEGRLIEHPDDPDGWKRLGRAKRVLGDLAGARAAYGEAVKRAPADGAALAGLAMVMVEQTGPETVTPEAADLFRRALALEPANGEALWFLGLLAAQSGDADQAVAMWRRLLGQLAPGSDEHRMLSRRIDELAAKE
ncbi:MAG TPA: c-type cytochrome biogenesis protein CcmI [Alphaproteobacteria bacterium]